MRPVPGSVGAVVSTVATAYSPVSRQSTERSTEVAEGGLRFPQPRRYSVRIGGNRAMRDSKPRLGITLLAAAASLAFAAPASATTFCVPGFHAACPSGGGNVAEASLQTAMNTNSDDGSPDRIVIAPGTVTHSDTYTIGSGDNDDLEIVGAGPGVTNITNTDTGNVFMINLNGPRAVTMRDLTLVIPASFNDNAGGALQAEQDTFENVDIESRNVRSDGINSAIGGSTFRDGRLYGAMGGSIDVGFSGNGAESGSLVVERTVIEEPSWGVSSDDAEVSVFVRRTRIVDPLAYGVRISDGAFGAVENTIIEADTGTPIVAESNDPGVVIVSLRHLTISGTGIGPNDPAVQAVVQNAAGNGLINLVARDTIIAGYPDPFTCQAPVSPTIGDANVTISHSYFSHSVNTSGDCNLSNGATIDTFAAGEPAFAGPGDFHLPPGSPAIDTGDPQVVSVTAQDFDGAFRPVDGDGDGAARRDMGAYEYQPPSPPANPSPAAAAKQKKCKKKKRKKKRASAAAAKKKRKGCKRKKKRKRGR